MRILICQYPFASPEANVETIARLVTESTISVDSSTVLILPEVAVGVWLDASNIEAPNRDSQMLAELAMQLGCHIVASVRWLEPEHTLPTNRWIWISPDGTTTAYYDKIHLFTPLGEHERYLAGTTSLVLEAPVKEKDGSAALVGAAVCYDLRFGQLFDVLRKQLVDIVIIPARWPASRLHHWQTMLRARAIEYQMWIVGVNAVGADPRNAALYYGGGSMVIDPNGDIHLQAGDETGVFAVSIDPAQSGRARAAFPVWNDRVAVAGNPTQ